MSGFDLSSEFQIIIPCKFSTSPLGCLRGVSKLTQTQNELLMAFQNKFSKISQLILQNVTPISEMCDLPFQFLRISTLELSLTWGLGFYVSAFTSHWMWVALERGCDLRWCYSPVWKGPNCELSVTIILTSWHNEWFHLKRDRGWWYISLHSLQIPARATNILCHFTQVIFIIPTW